METDIILYRKRYWIAGAVCLGNMANSIIWSSFGSITPTAKEYYGTSDFGINMLSIIFMILFIPVSPFSSWLLDTHGLRISVVLGSLLTVFGSAVRWLGGYSEVPLNRYITAVVAHSLAAIAQPFLLDAPTKVTSLWFGERERMTANTVISIGQPIGSAIALVIGPIIVSSPDQIRLLNLIILIITAALCIPSIWVSDKPPTPASHSRQVEHQTDFLTGIQCLVRNQSYLLLMTVFGIFLGLFNTYITLISDYIFPFGYSQDVSGILGAVTIGVGLFQAGFMGPILDRYPIRIEAFKAYSIVAAIGTTLFFVGTTRTIPVMMYVGSSLIGLGGFPLLPLCLELGVQVTFPVPEATSTGFLMWSGQAFGIIFLFLSQALRSSDGKLTNALVMITVVGWISALMSLVFRPRQPIVENEGEEIEVDKLDS